MKNGKLSARDKAEIRDAIRARFSKINQLIVMELTRDKGAVDRVRNMFFESVGRSTALGTDYGKDENPTRAQEIRWDQTQVELEEMLAGAVTLFVQNLTMQR